MLTRGLADALGADYGTWVCNTDGSAKRERRFIADVMARGADGLVIASVEPDQERTAASIWSNTRRSAWATASTIRWSTG